jgi:hypothetical protein
MIVYTLAFTLQGQDPKHNKYLQMVWIWLRFLCKYGNLGPNDKLFILVDKASREYLEEYGPYISLDIDYTFVEIPAPASVKDGILERFQPWVYFPIGETETVCYIDVDMFVLQDIHWAQDICKPGTFYAYPEETITGGNYLGEILTEIDRAIFLANPRMAELHPGFSGTFYFFQGLFVQKAFEKIIELTRTNTKYLYANEQPFYNRVLFDALYYTKEFSVSILNKDLIEYNCIVADCPPGTKLLNFCGEPGNQELHWAKMFMGLLADS